MNNLKNITALVTRPHAQGKILCEHIRAEGGQAIAFPTIAFEPVDYDLNPIINHSYDWIIFISREAAERADALIRRLPEKTRIAAIGKGTATVLHQMGVEKVVYPDNEWTSEGLLALPLFNNINQQQILIVRGEGGREWLGETLTARGASVDHLPVYRRTVPIYSDIGPYTALLREKRVNIIVCTSGESLHNLMNILGADNRSLIVNIAILVVSQRLAMLAKEYQFHAILLAKNASHEAIMDTLSLIGRKDYVRRQQ